MQQVPEIIPGSWAFWGVLPGGQAAGSRAGGWRGGCGSCAGSPLARRAEPLAMEVSPLPSGSPRPVTGIAALLRCARSCPWARLCARAHPKALPGYF